MLIFSFIRIRFIALCIACMASTTPAQPVRPAADRLDAIVSYPLIIPIIAQNERSLRSGVTTKLDDGRVLHSDAFWVGISPQPTLPGWTTSTGIWTATDYATITKLKGNQRPIGTWFINVPIPIDAVGQGLWFAGERYELNWLSDPQRTNLEAATNTHTQADTHSLRDLWAIRVSPDAIFDRAVRSVIDQYRHDPFKNWHARLLTDGLDPNISPSEQAGAQSLDALELELSMDTPGADLLRALARQHEARWQIILGRIWLIDPALAHRLKSQLIMTAQFGARTLPVWTSDANDLARLAHDLLSPFVDDKTRVLRAQAWLENQPRALAWITDDQGQIEIATNRFIPTISVLSLPSAPGASLFRVDSNSTAPELSTLPANLATDITVAIDPIRVSPSNPTLQSQSVRIRTGRWKTTREVIASPTPARAPYVRIGPMLNDWTMNALVTNRPLAGASPHPSRSTVGMLRRVAVPSRTNPTLGWQLFLELASPDPHSPNEQLTLRVGPYTNPFAVWTITPDGQVEFVSGSRFSIGLPKVETRILDGRWIAAIDLPTDAFDHDNMLQLGLERTDANGVHTAWPRRMIPDQLEPGRLSIDASNFDQLRAN